MAPIPHQLKSRQTLTDQGRQLDQPLQQGPHQRGQRQHHTAAHGSSRQGDPTAQLPPEQPNPNHQRSTGHQRRDRRDPELIGGIE